jgi:hypothetical protein
MLVARKACSTRGSFESVSATVDLVEVDLGPGDGHAHPMSRQTLGEQTLS